jgi:CRP-like cAMP-binding protein
MNKKDESIECLLEDYRLNIKISSYLRIPSNATFLPTQYLKEYRKKDSIKFYRDVGTQTHSIINETQADLKNNRNIIEEILINIISNNKDNYHFYYNILYEFIDLIESLSEDSVGLINKIIANKSPSLDCIKKLTTNSNNDIIDKLLRENNFIELENLINKINSLSFSKKGVRFIQENGLDENHKRMIALNNFRRIVRFVIINREWLKALEKDRNNDERDKLLLEYNKIENPLDFINCKKLQLLFNKEEFRAKKNLNNLISDLHKQILTRDQHKRSEEEIEILIDLIKSIPILNTFPLHVLNHISQLIRMTSYEKGRELVREGHIAVSFYYIVNGNCDVLSMSIDGLLKIDELQAGDTFGENSFNKNNNSTQITPHTIITSQPSELLVVEPSDINDYLIKMRLIEVDLIKSFASNWWPFKYWSWFEVEVEKFAQMAEFLRYSKGDMIFCSKNTERNDFIYFVYKGKIDLIRELEINRKKIIFKLCQLEKYNFFGFKLFDQNTISWFIASNISDNQVDVIRISKNDFLSIKNNSNFFYSQLIEDYKESMPNQQEEINLYKEAVSFRKSKKK